SPSQARLSATYWNRFHIPPRVSSCQARLRQLGDDRSGGSEIRTARRGRYSHGVPGSRRPTVATGSDGGVERRREGTTIRDVARHAHVGVGTVSRVLNDSPLVSEQTRRRVQRAIEELGYRPSATARNLSLGRSQTIGVVSP